MVSKAVAAAGTTYNEAKELGFMYQHGFQDPDGYIFEVCASHAVYGVVRLPTEPEGRF